MPDRIAEASRWLALRSNGERLSDGDEREFDRWIAVDVNRRAYAEVEALHAATGATEIFTAAEVRLMVESSGLEAKRRRRSLATPLAWWSWRGAGTVAFAVATIAIAALLWHRSSLVSAPVPYETTFAAGQPVQLADGSRVEMDRKTRFDAVLSDHGRVLRNFSGRAVLSVASDPQRPFLIETGNAKVRVVGTQFQLDCTPGELEVSVLHGIVEVVPATAGNSDISSGSQLRAGQRIRVSADGATSPVEAYPIAQFASWRRGRVEFRNRPLEEVVREANRSFDGTIAIEDEMLRQIPVSGSFQSSDALDFLTSLELIAPVKVVRTDPRRVEIRPRH